MCGEAIAHLAGPWGLSHREECALIAIVEGKGKPVDVQTIAKRIGYYGPEDGEEFAVVGVLSRLRLKLYGVGLPNAGQAALDNLRAAPELLAYINQPSVCPLCRKDAEEKAYRKARKEGR